MPSLTAYKGDLDYSYAPGIFPSMECLTYRPDTARRLLVHSSAEARVLIVLCPAVLHPRKCTL